jgi:hypothetical protein
VADICGHKLLSFIQDYFHKTKYSRPRLACLVGPQNMAAAVTNSEKPAAGQVYSLIGDPTGSRVLQTPYTSAAMFVLHRQALDPKIVSRGFDPRRMCTPAHAVGLSFSLRSNL